MWQCILKRLTRRLAGVGLRKVLIMGVVISNKLDHPAIVTDAPIAAILEGKGWVAQHIFEDVPNNDYRYLSIRTQDKMALIEVITDAEGKSYFKSFEGTTWSNDGTLHETFNRIIGYPREAETQVYINGTPNDIGSERFDKLILGGDGPKSSGSSNGIPKTSVMPPRTELTIQVQNVSGNTKDIGMTIEWAELEVLNE